MQGGVVFCAEMGWLFGGVFSVFLWNYRFALKVGCFVIYNFGMLDLCYIA